VWDRFIGHDVQEVADDVETGGLLVVGIDHVPRSLFDVGVGEHLVFSLGVVDPPGPRL
jgi:hypothetical protein